LRIPVLAGVATVSSHPQYWLDRLVSSATPQHQNELRQCIQAIAKSGTPVSAEGQDRFQILPQILECPIPKFQH